LPASQKQKQTTNQPSLKIYIFFKAPHRTMSATTTTTIIAVATTATAQPATLAPSATVENCDQAEIRESVADEYIVVAADRETSVRVTKGHLDRILLACRFFHGHNIKSSIRTGYFMKTDERLDLILKTASANGVRFGTMFGVPENVLGAVFALLENADVRKLWDFNNAKVPDVLQEHFPDVTSKWQEEADVFDDALSVFLDPSATPMDRICAFFHMLDSSRMLSLATADNVRTRFLRATDAECGGDKSRVICRALHDDVKDWALYCVAVLLAEHLRTKDADDEIDLIGIVGKLLALYSAVKKDLKRERERAEETDSESDSEEEEEKDGNESPSKRQRHD
jgi:hypothetical protein